MSSRTTVAVLGTGIMGAPIARNLTRAGFPVRAWNRSAEKARPLAEDGVHVAPSPEDAGHGADVVLTMLADAAAVLETVPAALADTRTWIQMSTIGLEGTERAAALAEEHGVAFVDAPVLGSRQASEDGKLTVLASGPSDRRDALAPLFDAIAARTTWVGEAGAGTRLKLVANAWVTALVEGLAETILFAEGLGVDPHSFLDAIAGGQMDSGYAQAKGRAMIDRSFAPPAFPLHLAAKDLGLIVEAAGRHDVDVPVLEAIARRFREATERGLGDLDMAATFLAGARDPRSS
jgi:3-hydroxyisobutyrate dehydrogenase